MRGKEAYKLDGWKGLRITPAYAGKRPCGTCGSSLHWDHPRVCGEKSTFHSRQGSEEGSPPRMRGKDFAALAVELYKGITPAYAGKSSECPSRFVLAWDHPRVCGEKMFQPSELHPRLGSPPRMRGKGQGQKAHQEQEGITPAYAGKSSRLTCGVFEPWDHPRVCGEKTKKIPSHRPFQLHPVPVSSSFA